MSTYKENGAEWMWILGAVGVAGAAYWLTHQKVPPLMPLQSSTAPAATPSVSSAAYGNIRQALVNALTSDEDKLYGPLQFAAGSGSVPTDPRRTTDAQIDSATQAWIRQDPTELQAIIAMFKNKQLSSAAALLATDPQKSASPIQSQLW